MKTKCACTRVHAQVDDGDVGFVIRAMFSPYELVSEKKKFNRQGILYAIDPVVNLATVNYILHGLQRFGFDKNDHKWWNTLWIALGIDHHFGGENNYKSKKFSEVMLDTRKALDALGASVKEKRTSNEAMNRLYYTLKMRTMRRQLADYLVKHVIKPFGIPRGSEKQGSCTSFIKFCLFHKNIHKNSHTHTHTHTHSHIHIFTYRRAAPRVQFTCYVARGLCHCHGD